MARLGTGVSATSSVKREGSRCEGGLKGVLAVVFAGMTMLVGEPAQRPNLILILADDMGYGDIQHLNPDSRIATPNLDRLGREGMTFFDAHSPSGVCTPTRYGVVTGRYCWRSRLKRGVLGGYSEPLLDHDQITIAEMLRAAGYQTAAVGKWHLGMALPVLGENVVRKDWSGDPGIDFDGVITDSPIHHGFGSYFGVSASLDMAPYVYVRNDRFTMKPTLNQAPVRFPHFVREGPRSLDFVIDEVLDRLTREAEHVIRVSATKNAPFFLYLPLTGPHKPTQPHPRFRGRTDLGEYGDFIVQVDWTVGSILSLLDEMGIAGNTLVVFTSDNGSYMYRYDDSNQPDHVDDHGIQGYRQDRHRANGPFRGTKADIWEGGHHVPFLVRWPNGVSAGATCSEPICLTDLYATFADLADTRVVRGNAEDSVSLIGMLRGQRQVRGVPVIHHSSGGMFAIRDRNWKLVLGNGSGGREAPRGEPFEAPYQLFDLHSDPGESVDVAERFPGVVESLTRKMMAIRDGRAGDEINE